MRRGRIGVRHFHVVMGFTIIMISNISRVGFSIAIVSMTDGTRTSSDVPVYDWNEAEKSAILSALFWGVPWLQIISGNLMERYGSKCILASTLTIMSSAALLIPYAANFGYLVLCMIRLLQGFVQGAFYPGVMVLLSKWSPPSERGRALPIAYSGGSVGTLIMLPLAGYLASTHAGWPSIFYFTGGVGFVWVFLWLCFGASSPSQHSYISRDEKIYIECSMIQTNEANKKKFKTPWKDIWRSVPVWAMIVTHFGQNWCFFTLLNEMPNYISGVSGVDIRKNGLFSALPYACASAMIYIFTWMAHKMEPKLSMSKTKQRKIWNSIGMWGSAICLFILGVLNSRNAIVIVCIFNLTVSLNAAISNGFLTNHVDMAPNFCGTLMGITNSLGHIGSVFGTLTTGWFVEDRKSSEQWMYVFILTSAVIFGANVVFLLFATSEKQRWNDPDQVAEDDDELEEGGTQSPYTCPNTIIEDRQF